jgi:hypothetical protein
MSAVVYLDAPHTASSSLCQYTNAAVSRRYRSSIHRLARQPWSSTDTLSAIGDSRHRTLVTKRLRREHHNKVALDIHIANRSTKLPT